MINKKVIQLVFGLLLLCTVAVSKEKGNDNANAVYHIKQHVMITMKDGSQVEGVIYSHISKNKYWVRQYHSDRQGKVKAKYLRPMSDTEVSSLKNK